MLTKQVQILHHTQQNTNKNGWEKRLMEIHWQLFGKTQCYKTASNYCSFSNKLLLMTMA